MVLICYAWAYYSPHTTGALKATELPINIVWAKNDPVAVLKIAETIHEETKNSQLTVLNNLGHFPMLENPEKWSNAVINNILVNK